MTSEAGDFSGQIDLALDRLFQATDFQESMNCVGELNRLLHTSDSHATQDPKAYAFVEQSWTHVRAEIKKVQARQSFRTFADFPRELYSQFILLIGVWQSLLRFHPRGEQVHRACTDIVNRAEPVELTQFIEFMEKVNMRDEEFIDPQVLALAKVRLRR